MSIIDDYKQLRMIENIKNFKKMEIAYKANLKLCKYQEQQINKLATCIEEIKEIARKTLNMIDYKTYFKRDNKSIKQEGFKALDEILQKISEEQALND